MPPVLVVLPPVLVALFPGCVPRVEVAGDTVAELLDGLEARWPGIRDRICDSRPAIRRHINVFIEGERAGLHTPVEPGAEVVILTAISGG